MRWDYFVLVSLLVIMAAGISGCTSSQGSTGTSDRDLITQGIAAGEQSCIDHLSSGVSEDKCRVTTTNTEIIISQITADAKAHQQTCLQKLQNSENPDLCVVSSAAIKEIAGRSAICIDNAGNNNVAAVRNCVDTAFAAVVS